jgi:hypothetical protein
MFCSARALPPLRCQLLPFLRTIVRQKDMPGLAGADKLKYDYVREWQVPSWKTKLEQSPWGDINTAPPEGDPQRDGWMAERKTVVRVAKKEQALSIKQSRRDRHQWKVQKNQAIADRIEKTGIVKAKNPVERKIAARLGVPGFHIERKIHRSKEEEASIQAMKKGSK